MQNAFTDGSERQEEMDFLKKRMISLAGFENFFCTQMSVFNIDYVFEYMCQRHMLEKKVHIYMF